MKSLTKMINLLRNTLKVITMGQNLRKPFNDYFSCAVSDHNDLRGVEEVDEAEDYEAPDSNPGQEL
jgi:hypothetical protein